MGHLPRPEPGLHPAQPSDQGDRDDVLFVVGPGHGGPAVVANVYLEGTIYPEVSADEAGLLRLVRQFSTPGGIPSHVSVPTRRSAPSTWKRACSPSPGRQTWRRSSLRSTGTRSARLALDVFIQRLGAEIAAMAAALGGLDALVFTGGIGENEPAMRKLACAAAAFLGVELDPGRNAAGDPDTVLSPPGAPASVVLVAAREDLETGRQARAALAG